MSLMNCEWQIEVLIEMGRSDKTEPYGNELAEKSSYLNLKLYVAAIVKSNVPLC